MATKKKKKAKKAPKPQKAAKKKVAKPVAHPKAPPKPAAFDQTFPELLASLHEIEIDYASDRIDLEPFQEFQSAEDNTSWIRAWTGNQELSGEEYRVFAQDGTGGYAAFWLVRDDAPLLEQPVVFFGSEGELGVVARSFADYLWLLAAGKGPYEAVTEGEDDPGHHELFEEFASTHAPEAKKTLAEVLAAARAEFPDFDKRIYAQANAKVNAKAKAKTRA